MDQPLHCYSCGIELVREHAHICPLCGQSFCYEHKEPEAHNCVKLGTMDWDVYSHERELWRKKNPRVSLGDKAPIDYEQVRAAHEIAHTRDYKKIRETHEITQTKTQKQDWSVFSFIVIILIALMAIYLLMRSGLI